MESGSRRSNMVSSGSGTPGASRSGDEHHSNIVSIEEQNDDQIQLRLLSDSMRSLLHDDHFSDVNFIVGEQGRIIPAHRCILAARCAPFYSMFMGEMRESSDNEIVIPNIEPDVFQSIIEFLYTGTLELEVASVFQIYKAADQYLLEDVKMACRSFIHQSLTLDHALVLLENARSCKFMDIYQVCLGYAAANASSLFKTLAFLDLTEETVGDLLDRHDIDMKEIDVFSCVKQWGETRALQSGRKVSDELVYAMERIRFPLMSQDELFEIVEPSGVAPSKMIMDACRYQAIRKEAAMQESVRFRTGVNFSRATIEHLSWFQPNPLGDTPSPRSLHTASAIGNRLFIFGGQESGYTFGDIFVLDIDTHQWSKPQTTGEAPGSVFRHAATLVGNSIFVFGGYDGQNDTNDLSVLDTDTMHWSRPTMRGPRPTPRENPCTALVGTRLFVVGGYADSALNDLYVLDTGSATWGQPPISGVPPSPRSGHSVTAIGHRLFVFGGGKWSGGKWKAKFNDLYCLDTDDMKWYRPEVSGQIPSGRTYHTATDVGLKLFVFGGGSNHGFLNDLFCLDTEMMVWARLRVDGIPPVPRDAHVACVLDDTKIMIHGGNDGFRALDDLHILCLFQRIQPSTRN